MRGPTVIATLGVAAFCITAWPAARAGAYQAGPPPGVTGGFGENSCIQCHSTFALNEGQQAGLGALQVSGVPAQYEAGRTYRLTVQLTHEADRMVWGFQLAARTGDGKQAGELKPADESTRVLAQEGVQYIEHTREGTYNNVFAFDWTAPSGGAAVQVHVAGNAANGDSDMTGDYIYTTSITVPAVSH